MKKYIVLGMDSIVMLYNLGYRNGHNDTVESQYTDIFQCDMETYHEDVVGDYLAETIEDKQPRCETCRWWANSPWQETPETRLCLYPEKREKAEEWGVVGDCGPHFCCCHWEGRNE